MHRSGGMYNKVLLGVNDHDMLLFFTKCLENTSDGNIEARNKLSLTNILMLPLRVSLYISSRGNRGWPLLSRNGPAWTILFWFLNSCKEPGRAVEALVRLSGVEGSATSTTDRVRLRDVEDSGLSMD
jgi:hypothetical protein